MSLYSIAESTLTTAADRKRRPLVDRGQIGRTVALSMVALIAVIVRTHLG